MFETRLQEIVQQYQETLNRRNRPLPSVNGIYERFAYPVLTRAHIPLTWRFDLDEKRNPFLLERIGVNAAFNAGAIEYNGKICLVVRVEGMDRKSFFAVAESETGVDGFRFRQQPIVIPALDDKETNFYDMRLTKHEDGWIYGLFCVEKHDDSQPADPSAATAACGVVRTKDLERWERLPDIVSDSQQRNVVLHPEFVDGKYALYTRPSDSFIEVGGGNGIGWALTDTMDGAVIGKETIIDERIYHTIKEVKNGQGAPPIKTPRGWVHVPHGVRAHAGGLRYVLYLMISAPDDPARVLHRPGGYLIAPYGEERTGDVPGVVFSNGMVMRENGEVLIYYAGSDTRTYVIRTHVDRLLDYGENTPEDGYTTHASVQQRLELIEKNNAVLQAHASDALYQNCR